MFFFFLTAWPVCWGVLNEPHQPNWIVVTTSSESPPKVLLEFVESHAEWSFVVVALSDQIKSWPSLPRTSFLDFNTQSSLPFRSAKKLHLAASRKNVGYLFAIQNGARVIYDTDDSCLHFSSVNRLASLSSNIVVVNKTLNPFRIFRTPFDLATGQPS